MISLHKNRQEQAYQFYTRLITNASQPGNCSIWIYPAKSRAYVINNSKIFGSKGGVSDVMMDISSIGQQPDSRIADLFKCVLMSSRTEEQLIMAAKLVLKEDSKLVNKLTVFKKVGNYALGQKEYLCALLIYETAYKYGLETRANENINEILASLANNSAEVLIRKEQYEACWIWNDLCLTHHGKHEKAIKRKSVLKIKINQIKSKK